MKRGLDWLFLLLAMGGCALLLQLGFWQLDRLTWKEQLITAMQSALDEQAQPMSLADAARRFVDEPAADYLLVAGEGQYEGTVRWLYAIVDGRPGWHAVNPVRLADGGLVLVDRGAVPDEMRGALPAAEGAVSFRGFARRPQLEAGAFQPASQAERGFFYWRDVRAMTGGKDAHAFIVELLPAATDAPWPRAAKPDPAALPNKHLSYAITWFSLAGLLAGLTGFFLWTRRKSSTPGGGA